MNAPGALTHPRPSCTPPTLPTVECWMVGVGRLVGRGGAIGEDGEGTEEQMWSQPHYKHISKQISFFY